MKDDRLISLNAAIDALDRLEYTPGEWATNGMTMCKDAIKALPSATDTNVATTDTISRQAAISEIMEDIKDRSLHDDPATPEDYAEGYDEGIRNAAAIVLRVPSVQPTCTNTVQVDDCISREAAVEAMRKAKDKSEAHRMLMQLPSAQKYGTWIVSHFGANAKCSKCGMYCVGAYDHDRCDQYCRCCGAKMDGLKLEGEEP